MPEENRQPHFGSIKAEEFFGRQTFVRMVHYLESIDSTNTYARRLVEQGSMAAPTETPFLVLADSQTAGRGREGRSWWTGSGSLPFTVAFRLPNLWGLTYHERTTAEAAPQVGFAAALSVIAAVIRWATSGSMTLPVEEGHRG